jgi:hypothetical protein
MKICQYCGKEYYVGKSQEKRSKFCSDKCFRTNKNKQVQYNCDYCGKPFMITRSQVDKVKSGKKKGLYCCSQCAKDVQKPKWNDISSLFKERDYELISTEYINAKTKLKYICNKHRGKGIQSITYNNLKCGFGCTYCGDERTVEARRLSFEEVKEIFSNHNMDLLDQQYVNAHTPMAYICRHHSEVGIQYMTASNAVKQHCPYCHIIKGENRLIDYFIKNNVVFESQKTFDGLVGIKSRSLKYDFYLPDYNILIEYQGEQHERPVERFGGEEQFKIQLEHDKRKREYAMSQNIELLEIWYYDFNNIETILNNKLTHCIV